MAIQDVSNTVNKKNGLFHRWFPLETGPCDAKNPSSTSKPRGWERASMGSI